MQMVVVDLMAQTIQ